MVCLVGVVQIAMLEKTFSGICCDNASDIERNFQQWSASVGDKIKKAHVHTTHHWEKRIAYSVMPVTHTQKVQKRKKGKKSILQQLYELCGLCTPALAHCQRGTM